MLQLYYFFSHVVYTNRNNMNHLLSGQRIQFHNAHLESKRPQDEEHKIQQEGHVMGDVKIQIRFCKYLQKITKDSLLNY